MCFASPLPCRRQRHAKAAALGPTPSNQRIGSSLVTPLTTLSLFLFILHFSHFFECFFVKPKIPRLFLLLNCRVMFIQEKNKTCLFRVRLSLPTSLHLAFSSYTLRRVAMPTPDKEPTAYWSDVEPDFAAIICSGTHGCLTNALPY